LILNIRRSQQMSETFTFDVNYATSFEDLEKLRSKMLAFLESESSKRDFQPVFDVTVVDFPEQSKMTLSADIKYKSNSQQSALKAKRRNKWICALKVALHEVGIYGPNGDPTGKAPTARYTQVPWEEVKAEDKKASSAPSQSTEVPAGGWQLSDKNAVLLSDADDIFEDSDELHMNTPKRGLSTEDVHSRPSGVRLPSAVTIPSAEAVGSASH